jgi:outer membrane protein assembly factor BamB
MHALAVVPIFMSAGAAVLPTFLGALAGLGAILLKPRELVALFRRRPVALLGVLAGIAMVVVCGSVVLGAVRKPAPSAQGSGKGSINWASIGQAIVDRQGAGMALTPVAATVPTGAFPHDGTPPEAATEPGDTGILTPLTDPSQIHTDNSGSPQHLRPFWTFRPEGTMFLARPAIAEDRIYAAGCVSELGDFTGLLACLDARTGKPVWQISDLQGEPLKPFFSSPAITPDGRFLLIGQGLHQDRDCSLLCFDTGTGTLRWSVKTPLHIESSPAISGDLVVVGAGAIEGQDGRPTGDPGFVLAVRISDGRELWRHRVIDPESSPIIGSDGTIYIGSGFNGDAVVALRSASDDELRHASPPLSRQLWQTRTSMPMTGDLTLAGDLIIAGGGNGDFVHSNANPRGIVIALDRRTGVSQWQASLPDSVLGSIAFRDGRLIVPCRSGEVFALAVDNGRILWRNKVAGQAPILAGCAATDTCIYTVTADGFLAILDGASGKLLEKNFLNDLAKAGSGLTGCPPQIAQGQVIVGSETGGIQCLVGAGKRKTP